MLFCVLANEETIPQLALLHVGNQVSAVCNVTC